jgi:hypothetical protein
MGPDEFFPADPCTPPPVICDTCPVRVDCWKWGLYHEENGSWGGFSEAALDLQRHIHGIEVERVGLRD